jgi:DNA-binding transcriptional ArsR family regulator
MITEGKPDLLLHPIRGRIMMTLAARTLTTRQMAALLPDVPIPSLYRQVRILLDAGLLVLAGEEGEGRAAERVYARADQEDAGELAAEDVLGATTEQLMEQCSAFLGVLLAQFRASLHSSPSASAFARRYLCGAAPLVLPPERHGEFVTELKALIERYGSTEALETGGPARVTFATIVFPEPSPVAPKDGEALEEE